jgi:hypothetical protein
MHQKALRAAPAMKFPSTRDHEPANQPQQAGVEWRLQEPDGEVYVQASYGIHDETKCTCAALPDAARRRTLAGSRRRTRK